VGGAELLLSGERGRRYVVVRSGERSFRVRVRREPVERLASRILASMRAQLGIEPARDEVLRALEALGLRGAERDDEGAAEGVTVSNAERRLAAALRRKGVPFRAQARIGRYVVDFLIPPDVVVEVEGLVHYLDQNVRHDLRRLRDLEAMGYVVYRIEARDVRRDPLGCAEMIKQVWLRRRGAS